MGVLVFILCLLASDRWISYEPDESGEPWDLPSARLVPKVQSTAKILYGIYLGMTVLQIHSSAAW